MIFVCVIFLLAFGVSQAACVDCTTLAEADAGTYADAKLWMKTQGLATDRVLYDTAPETGYTEVSTYAEGKFLTVKKDTATAECLVELFSIKWADAFNFDYYQTASATDRDAKKSQAFIPYNAASLASRWCATTNGGYGASIPVYRYRYGLTDHLLANPGGILADKITQAFSPYFQDFNDKTVICYIWPTDNQTPNSATCATTSTGLTLTAFKIFSNSHDASVVTTNRLDFQTGVAAINSTSYTEAKSIAQVLTAAGTCKCAVPLYTYLKTETTFGGRDTTLSTEDSLTNYVKQTTAALTMYCVKKSGDCGATVPIMEYYNAIADDRYVSLQTDKPTNYQQLINFGSTASTPICYVWSA